MSVTVQTEGNCLVAALRGEIDHHSAGALREAIDDAVCASRAETLVLDFGGVTFMDSSGVGLVMGRVRLARGRGMTVRVVNLSSRDLIIMTMSGIEKIAELQAKSR